MSPWDAEKLKEAQTPKGSECVCVSSQVYSHPDVVECCLVLLHLSKLSSSSVPETLQKDAKELLRKYGTSPSVLKASKKFLI